MTSTQTHPTTPSTRRSGIFGLTAVLAIGIIASSCGVRGEATDNASPKPVGYSYHRDSRINETPTTMGYSYYHDSRINETPVDVDDSGNHDSHHDG